MSICSEFTLDLAAATESDDGGGFSWPTLGQTFKNIAIEVFFDGDREHYAVLDAPDVLGDLLSEFDISDLIDPTELPIASGIYEMDLEFWSLYTRGGWEDPSDDYECGFHVHNFRRSEI